jgi:hypothetical protein
MFRRNSEEDIVKQYKRKLKIFRRNYNNRLIMSYAPVGVGTAAGGTTGAVVGNMLTAKMFPNATFKVKGMSIGVNSIGRVAGGALGGLAGGRVGLPYAQDMAVKRIIPSSKNIKTLLPRNDRERRVIKKYLKDTNINAIVTSAKDLIPKRSDVQNILPSQHKRNNFLQALKLNSAEYTAKKAVKQAQGRY